MGDLLLRRIIDGELFLTYIFIYRQNDSFIHIAHNMSPKAIVILEEINEETI